MKAFEEVFQHDIDVPRYAAEKYWRAALEWIYVEMTGLDLSHARDMINEELGEE